MSNPPHVVRLVVFWTCGVGFLAIAIPLLWDTLTRWSGILFGEYVWSGHEFHNFVIAALFGVLLVGVIVTLVPTTRTVGGLHSGVVIWGTFVSVFLLVGQPLGIHTLLLGLLVGMVLFHPSGWEQFPAVQHVNWATLSFTLLTAIGAFSVAGIELYSHFTATNGHLGFGHYLFMTSTWASIGALVVLGNVSPTGWRFPSYAAAFLLGVIGVSSMLFPGAEQGSSLGVVLGGVALTWAVLIVLVAERGEAIGATADRALPG